MNEWELLVSSEGIRKGDLITVELENGTCTFMKLIKWTDAYVLLKNQDKELVKFRADNLEAVDDSIMIIGKAADVNDEE